MSTDHLNNALNSSWSSGDDQGSDPTHYSQVGHSSSQDLHHSGMADLNQNYGTDQFSGINDPGLINPDYHQAGYYHQPDYHQPDYHQSVGYGDNFQYGDRAYDLGNVGYEHQTLSFASQGTVLNSSSQSHSCVYTTINDYGQIYKHTEGESGGYYVGSINGRKVYNFSNQYLRAVSVERYKSRSMNTGNLWPSQLRGKIVAKDTKNFFVA